MFYLCITIFFCLTRFTRIYVRLLSVLYSLLWTCIILILRRIFPEHNNFSFFRYFPTFSLSLSLSSLLFIYCCTRVLDERDFIWSVCMCVCVCISMGIRRKSYDVLPATGPSWFPPLATTLRGVKRRQNDRGWNDREGRSKVETRLLFFVLARPRNPSVSLAIMLIWSRRKKV